MSKPRPVRGTSRMCVIESSLIMGWAFDFDKGG